MQRPALILVLSLCLAPAGAQEPSPTAPPQTGWLAQTARALEADGALAGLLGVRFLRDPDGGLVVLQAELDDPEAPSALRCSVSFLTVGGMREEWTRLDCALDLASGRFTHVGSAVVRGRRKVFAAGVVTEGRLTMDLEVREDGETTQHQTTVDWEEDRVPWGWAVFFLPALREQLPAEFSLRIYHEAVQRLDGALATWTRSEEGVSWAGVFPGQPPVQVRPDPSGWQVDLGAAGLLKAVDGAEGQRLWRAAKATMGD